MAPIDCYDIGYILTKCCTPFNVPKYLFRNHLSGKTKSKIIKAKIIFTKQEEELIIEYIDEMLKIGDSLTIYLFKMKIIEICQNRLFSFKNDIQRIHGCIGLKKGTFT